MGNSLTKSRDWRLVHHGVQNLPLLGKVCREPFVSMEKEIRNQWAQAQAWYQPVTILPFWATEEIMRRAQDQDPRRWWGAREWLSWKVNQ